MSLLAIIYSKKLMLAVQMISHQSLAASEKVCLLQLWLSVCVCVCEIYYLALLLEWQTWSRKYLLPPQTPFSFMQVQDY